MNNFTCTHLLPPVYQNLQQVFRDCKILCTAKIPQLGRSIKIIGSSVGHTAVRAQHILFRLYWKPNYRTDCSALSTSLMQCIGSEFLADLVFSWLRHQLEVILLSALVKIDSLGWKIHETEDSVGAKLTCTWQLSFISDSLFLKGQEELDVQKEWALLPVKLCLLLEGFDTKMGYRKLFCVTGTDTVSSHLKR